MMYNLSFDDLTFIVCAANIAGRMEAWERINVPDDDRLTDSCLKIYEEYKNISPKSEAVFHGYALKRLKDIYG